MVTNQIGKIDFVDNFRVGMPFIYSKGSFIIFNDNDSSKRVFIEYNLNEIPKITPVNCSNLEIRISSPNKVFYFEKVAVIERDANDEMQEKKSIKV